MTGFDTVALVCFLIAFILFILASINSIQAAARVNLMALGLAAFVLPFLIRALDMIN